MPPKPKPRNPQVLPQIPISPEYTVDSVEIQKLLEFNKNSLYSVVTNVCKIVGVNVGGPKESMFNRINNWLKGKSLKDVEDKKLEWLMNGIRNAKPLDHRDSAETPQPSGRSLKVINLISAPILNLEEEQEKSPVDPHILLESEEEEQRIESNPPNDQKHDGPQNIFLNSKMEIDLAPRIWELIMSKGGDRSFFEDSIDISEKKEILIRWPKDKKLPSEVPNISQSLKGKLSKSAQRKDRELESIQKRLLESIQPLIFLADHIAVSEPQNFQKYGQAIKDSISLITVAQDQLTQIRKKNATLPVGGKAAVDAIARTPKIPLLSSDDLQHIKEASKLDSALSVNKRKAGYSLESSFSKQQRRSFRGKPFSKRGSFRGGRSYPKIFTPKQQPQGK
jgi:hypothetical protein